MLLLCFQSLPPSFWGKKAWHHRRVGGGIFLPKEKKGKKKIKVRRKSNDETILGFFTCHPQNVAASIEKPWTPMFWIQQFTWVPPLG